MRAAKDPLYTDTGNDVIDFNNALAAWNGENGANIDAGDNFVVCNEAGCLSSVPKANINVSPNEYFDVAYFCQANAMNAADASAQSVLQAMYEGGYSAWATIRT